MTDDLKPTRNISIPLDTLNALLDSIVDLSQEMSRIKDPKLVTYQSIEILDSAKAAVNSAYGAIVIAQMEHDFTHPEGDEL